MSILDKLNKAQESDEFTRYIEQDELNSIKEEALKSADLELSMTINQDAVVE